MNITPEQYSEMSKKASPKSNTKVNLPVAFAVGGAICALGEIIMTIFQRAGLDETSAGTWTSIILVGLSALLTGLGWYEKIAKHEAAMLVIARLIKERDEIVDELNGYRSKYGPLEEE